LKEEGQVYYSASRFCIGKIFVTQFLQFQETLTTNACSIIQLFLPREQRVTVWQYHL